jgi:hypothetical protein
MTNDATNEDPTREPAGADADRRADEEESVPPPADFDPAEHPSNPDLVDDDG